MKTSIDIIKFTMSYSEQDDQLIRLKSNGLQGQYFMDENEAFRKAVIDVVLKASESVPPVTAVMATALKLSRVIMEPSRLRRLVTVIQALSLN